MNKYMKTVGMTAALAVMIPLSAYAATSTSTTTTDSTAAVTSTQKQERPAGGHHGGRGGFGGQFISDDVLTLLGLDRAALQEKLAAGSTLQEIATAQGVTAEQLKAALTKAFDAKQAEEKTQFTSNLDTYISTKQEQRAEGSKGGFGFGGGQYLSTVATTLGVTEDVLKEEIQAGKTISAIATEKGVDVATVTKAIETAINAKIDQAVTDGKLTADQAAAQKEKSADQAEKIAAGEFTGKGGFGGGHRGEGGKKSAQPSTSTSTGTSTGTSTTGTNA